MALIKCANGHYYNDNKHSVCPYCGDSVRLSLASQMVSSIPSSTPSDEKMSQKTEALDNARITDDAKTVGLFQSKYEQKPIVGWLVCISGAATGKDYRLYSGQNFIGRSAKMDICLSFDMQVSGEKHAAIVYDPIKNEFILLNISGNSVLLDGESVTEPIVISDGAALTLGETVLLFRALCRNDFVWQL